MASPSAWNNLFWPHPHSGGASSGRGWFIPKSEFFFCMFVSMMLSCGANDMILCLDSPALVVTGEGCEPRPCWGACEVRVPRLRLDELAVFCRLTLDFSSLGW